MKKICNECNEEKEISEFYKNKKTKDGYETKCKKCRYEREKAIKKGGKESIESLIRRSILIENKKLKEFGLKLCSGCHIEKISLETKCFCAKCEKDYYKKNKDVITERGVKYRIKNKSELSKRRKEKYKKQSKDEKFIKKRKEIWKKYSEKNREKINKKQKERRELKKLQDEFCMEK